MTRPLLAAAILGAVLAGPASAQQSQPQQDLPPQTQADKVTIGLPVFSSDGQKLGEVTDVGELADGKQAIRAEMGQFLGIGSTPVVIGPGAFQKKADRVEVALTADEVRDTLAKQRQKRDRNLQ
jgi:PRC-barrel domain